jgi:regulatory protein
MPFRKSATAKKTISPAQAFTKIASYCAYQERSHKEVKNKLYEYGLHENEVDELVTRMITEGFLNEERFAKAFAGGKFRIKKWGRLKIVNELEALGLTKKCIQKGLNEIDTSDYVKTLKGLIKKKAAQLDEDNQFKKRDKIARYVISKGYEPEQVWEIVKDVSHNGKM